jgi:lipopolysaccharide export LptBFGC system permease protein LptF
VPKRDVIKDSVRHSVLFARHVVPAAVKPARTLWNEVIGSIFMVFGVAFGYSAVKEALSFKGDTPVLLTMIAASLVSLVMLFYGFQSFRKARQISRS